MPDFLSHALFAQQLLERGDFAHHADCAAHSPLFRLGSQGPDLFYYLAYVSPGHDFSGLADCLHGLRAEQLLPLAAEVSGPTADSELSVSEHAGLKRRCDREAGLNGGLETGSKCDPEAWSKYDPGTGLEDGLDTRSKCDPEAGLKGDLGTESNPDSETEPQRNSGGGATVFQSAQARAYLCGVIAHLCLDEAAHPYIERRSAEIAAAEPGISESCAHVRLESCFEARQLALETGRQPKEYDARGDLPADSEERRVICAVWQRILAVGGLPPLDSKTEKALLQGLRRLPLLFSLLFDRRDIAKSVLDFFHLFAKGDATLRWHIKRPYDPANTPLAASDAEEIEARYAAALAAYPSLLGPEII